MGCGCVVGLKPDLPCRRRRSGRQGRTGWWLARLPEPKATAKPKVKGNHPAPMGHPSSERRGIKAKAQRSAVVGNNSPARATVSLAPPPVGRASARFRHVLRDSPPPPPAGAMACCRVVGLKPDLPCHSGEGGRWCKRTGWLLARPPELKPRTKSPEHGFRACLRAARRG